MTHQPEIWKCIKKHMTSGHWTDIQDIYKIVQINISLDREDFYAQSPTSATPKWMRNVRNVLQYRKSTGDIEWDGAAKYRL